MTPIQVISRPDAHQERIVISDFNAPTRKCATRLMPNEIITAVIISFGISLVAHFLVGALKSLITIRSWWASGLEMTWIGVIVAVVTYGLGLAFGALG